MEQTTTIINEVWRSIDGFRNYQVSNVGRVRNATTGMMLKQTVSNNGYKKVSLYNDQGLKNIAVHTVVAREFLARPPDEDGKLEVDHINRSKTDNQVSNLRYVSHSQNMMNRRKQTRRVTSSQYKGVQWCKLRQRWKATIKLDGRRMHLGLYACEEEAALAYDLKAEEIFGEHALLNF
jgi:hypothetical protein